MTSYKVRIYDLAKELKMESKRIMEEVRREGVDVSVPSNTISKELAEKIRNKYFPKKEPTVQRAVRVVKKAKPVESDEAAHADDAAHAEAHADAADEVHAATEADAAPDAVAAQPHAESPSTGAATGGAVRPLVPRLIKKEPAARAERPEGAQGPAEAPAPETEAQMITAPEAAAEA